VATAPQAVPAAANSAAVSTTGVLAATAVETATVATLTTDVTEATLQDTVTREPTVLTAIVSTGGDRLNVRSGPGAGYAVIDKVANGAALTVVGRNAAGDWLQIQVPDAASELGWVAASFVQVGNPTTVTPVTM
jgi:uncharacterized protein YgiM (DUF1202 family)